MPDRKDVARGLMYAAFPFTMIGLGVGIATAMGIQPDQEPPLVGTPIPTRTTSPEVRVTTTSNLNPKPIRTGTPLPTELLTDPDCEKKAPSGAVYIDPDNMAAKCEAAYQEALAIASGSILDENLSILPMHVSDSAVWRKGDSGWRSILAIPQVRRTTTGSIGAP